MVRTKAPNQAQVKADITIFRANNKALSSFERPGAADVRWRKVRSPPPYVGGYNESFGLITSATTNFGKLFVADFVAGTGVAFDDISNDVILDLGSGDFYLADL